MNNFERNLPRNDFGRNLSQNFIVVNDSVGNLSHNEFIVNDFVGSLCHRKNFMKENDFIFKKKLILLIQFENLKVILSTV